MAFQFQLLGLLILVLLIAFYYAKKENFVHGEGSFKMILLTTYIMQLLYLSTYIAIKTESNPIWFGKCYLISIVIWFSLYTMYDIVQFLKAKYPSNETILNQKKIMVRNSFIAINLFTPLIILISNIQIKEMIIHEEHNIFMIFIGVYLLIDFIMILKSIKKIPTKKWIHLFVMFMIETLLLELQTIYPNLPVINTGVILVVLYLYMTLENSNVKELETLKLERDYALKQSMNKSAFLKNLSHEIRTPLNTIDGFSQVILDSNSIEEIKGDIKDIRIASKDLINVINGMIDLSIIESGNLEIIEENYNVYDMIDNIIEISKSKMKDKKIDFTVKIAKDIPKVLLGDSDRISQVVLNIMMNSIKYTDKGNISIEIESVKSSSRCRLKIVIKDTSKGFKKEELNQIFEYNDREEKNNLGLSIAKHLTELMNGKIDVDSVYEKETTFTVTIDQKIISENYEEKVDKKKIMKPFSAPEKRILIVDDNKLNLKVVRKLLAPYEVEVVEANSGKECLDILDKDTNFDLILMDDLMPEMSGTETLDIIKKIERIDGYYIPVVVLTANAFTGMKEKYLNIGFEDYLSKPIDKYELDRILKKYLKNSK
ncbi:MAG: response regulator [Erysipelotrichaceae bacterium]|nr:response regulator [Erysipelotrichaceae bacterium]